MIRPSTCFPAEFAVIGIDLHFQPVDSRIINRTLLLKGYIGINADIYPPYLIVSALNEFPVNRIPPPFAWMWKCIVKGFSELVRWQEIHCPEHTGIRLGKFIVRIGP